jgi:hypothetical protein
MNEPSDRTEPEMAEMATNNGMSSIDRYLPFIARACLVLLFPFSALDKIFDHGNAVAQADASGVAGARLAAACSVVASRCSDRWASC